MALLRLVTALHRAAGGKLVDASPDTEKQLQDELEKLARQYGAKGADFAKFPTFGFTGVYYSSCFFFPKALFFFILYYKYQNSIICGCVVYLVASVCIW